MALFYDSGMAEFKTMKTIYANRVHKFVLDWFKKTTGMSDGQRLASWNQISKTRLGNLLKPDMIRPKKYKNKYICFCELMRPKLKRDHPTKSIKEITKMMGLQWKTFSEQSDPELYAAVNKLWEADQVRYSQEKTLSSSLSKDKYKQDSHYIKFCKQARLQNPKITMLELAEQWNQQQIV